MPIGAVTGVRHRSGRSLPGLAAALACLAASAAMAATASGAGQLSGLRLVQALRQGGYVLVMRHASSPRMRPNALRAAIGNLGLQRQLSRAGLRAARAMGRAIHALDIPIGRVLSSPLFRALETVRAAHLPRPRTVPELAEGRGGMSTPAGAGKALWLRARVKRAPAAGTNTLIVTHTPNIEAAFGAQASGTSAGEMLVFHPDGHGGSRLVGRIKIDQWPRLAAQRSPGR